MLGVSNREARLSTLECLNLGRGVIGHPIVECTRSRVLIVARRVRHTSGTILKIFQLLFPMFEQCTVEVFLLIRSIDALVIIAPPTQVQASLLLVAESIDQSCLLFTVPQCSQISKQLTVDILRRQIFPGLDTRSGSNQALDIPMSVKA